MIIVVQQITTHWTQRSRSAPNAALRNQTPTQLPLPKIASVTQSHYVHHHNAFKEDNQFAEPQQSIKTTRLTEERIQLDCLQVWLDEAVRVQYMYNMSNAGAPQRSAFPRIVCTLDAGEWGQVVYNGRFSHRPDSGGWRYHKQIFNIAHLASYMSNPFENPPKQMFSDLAHLL